MSYYFPTAKNVNIALDGYNIDLSFRCDWKESQPRIPRYGYNDYRYTRTIPGRNIIHGFLVMQFVVPNYLGVILEERAIAKADKSFMSVEEIMNGLPGVEDNESRTARAQTLASILFPPNKSDTNTKQTNTRFRVTDPVEVNSDNVKEHLIRRFIDGEKPISTPTMASPLEFHSSYTMDVYYHNIENAPWHLRFFDVEITDVSHSYSAAGAEGSAEPIYETYEFIASRRKTITEVRDSDQKDLTPLEIESVLDKSNIV